MLSDRAAQLVAAKNRLEELSNNFDVRKLAARMEDKQEDYYILCGWMAEDDVDKFLEEVKEDEKYSSLWKTIMTHISENRRQSWKIRNYSNHLKCSFRCMDFPAHNEMDPTMFVGLTYSFIFGVMFGDVGQGLFF